jgi:hypothetical protein
MTFEALNQLFKAFRSTFCSFRLAFAFFFRLGSEVVTDIVTFGEKSIYASLPFWKIVPDKKLPIDAHIID